MKNRIHTLLLGAALSLATCFQSQASSQLLSLSALPLWPVSTSPNTSVAYSVSTVGRGGSGVLEIELTAGGLPPGVTVTFTPSVLRFTGNALTTQTATMTVLCTVPTPVDAYPFTITATTTAKPKVQILTITNLVMFTPEFVANRPATLYMDNLGAGSLLVRGLGATARNYQIQATYDLANPVWTSVGTTTADGNGRFIFPISQTTPARFFRSMELP